MTIYNGVEINEQIKGINEMLDNQIEEAKGIKEGIQEFVNNSELESEAYRNQKNYFNTVYVSLYNGIERFAETFKAANRRLQSCFLNVANDTNARVDTNNLEQEVTNLYSTTRYWSQMTDSHPYADYFVGINQGLINLTQGILDRMNIFIVESGENYTTAREYLELVKRGMDAIKNDYWDATTGTFNTSDMDTSWIKEIDYKIKIKKLIDEGYLTVDGDITSKGYEIYEELMKKDIDTLTISEGELLVLITIQANTKEEIERILELGYCVEKVSESSYGTKGRKSSETFEYILVASEKYMFANYLDGVIDSSEFREQFMAIETMISVVETHRFIADYNYPLQVEVDIDYTEITITLNNSKDSVAIKLEDLGSLEAADANLEEHLRKQADIREKHAAMTSLLMTAMRLPNFPDIGGKEISLIEDVTDIISSGSEIMGGEKKEGENGGTTDSIRIYNIENLGNIARRFGFNLICVEYNGEKNSHFYLIPGDSTEAEIERNNQLKEDWETNGVQLNNKQLELLRENENVTLTRKEGTSDVYIVEVDLEDLEINDFYNDIDKLESYYKIIAIIER